MANYSDDGGISNNGFMMETQSSVHPHSPYIPPEPKEELGIPNRLFSDHSPPSAGPGVADSRTSGSLSEHGAAESSPNGEHNEDNSQSGPCGYCCWVPACLRRAASGRVFVVFLSLLSLTESGLTVGYISGMVTSFELQFNFSSTMTGFVISCYDIGSLVVILTSYFGGRVAANRPKWIAWSAWVMSLGATIVTLPHFFNRYQVSGEDSVAGVCRPNASSYTENEWDEPASGDTSMKTLALIFLIPGMMCIGAGSTATITLGTTYIDDSVRKKESPILLALLFSTTVIGPALGFLIGSFFLGYYVDFDVTTTDGPGSRPLSPSSPRWVGAWWLGFFFFAGAIMIMAFPIYAFPARLKKPTEKLKEDGMKETGEDSEDSDANVRMAFSNVSLKKIPLAVWGLLTNPVYMMINIAAAAEFSIVTGFVRFAPKFVQSQFQLEATQANLITGTLIPVGAVGVIFGGFILNRVKTSLMSTVNVLTVCTVISGLCYGLIYIPGPCNNVLFAGVTAPYRHNDGDWKRPTNPYNINLTRSCNAACHCPVSSYSPVCSEAGVAYFSPCFAGCEDKRNATKGNFEYYNCTCVEDYNATGPADNAKLELGHTFAFIGDSVNHLDEAAEATTGLCPSDCWKLPLFLALLLLVVFASSVEQMPALMALLRSIKKEERPFALGFQFVIMRLFGFIPSPIYYGSVIDSTCVLWQERQGQDGACRLYDNSNFYYRYLGLSTFLKSISVITAVAIWLFVRRRHMLGATASRLSSPDSLGDSGVGGTNSDGLSDDISARGRFRYTEEGQPVPAISGSIEQ